MFRSALPIFEIARVLVRLDHVASIIVKPFCHAGQNFPKEKVKARNEFSMTREHGRPKMKEKEIWKH